MANRVLKAPSTIAPGAQFQARDGTQYVIGAGGYVTIDSAYLADAKAAGFTEPVVYGGIDLFSGANGIVANANGGQANGTLLANGINRITTTGAANASVRLPASAAGMVLDVQNAGANTANIYPAVNDAIDALGANAAFQLATGKNVQLECPVAGQWHAILTA